MSGNLLMNICQDEVERARFRSRRKFQTDLQSDLATVEDRGIAIGEKNRSLEIARNLLKMFPFEQIAMATGLTLAEIDNL